MIDDMDENATTASLRSLLVSTPRAREVFLDLVFPRGVPTAFKGKFDCDFRHRTDRGPEIDLLLSRGKEAVIVECKVRDAQKVYQLEEYRNYWRRRHGREPVLVWLVRQPQKLIGMDALGARTITWNQLHDALVESCRDTGTREFCAALTEKGICVAEGERIERAKIYRGYDPEQALSILERIAGNIPGLRSHPVQMNELDLALHAGSETWQSFFQDGWDQRIIFYFKPLGSGRGQRGPYFFHGQVLLYHVRTAREPYFSGVAVRSWREMLEREGLPVWRNRMGKWKGRDPVKRGMNIALPVKYIYAEEPEEAARRRFPFDWRNDDEAVAAGTRHLGHFVKLVERLGRLLSTTA